MPGGLKADHHANRLLAALDPDDFARLAPHLEIMDLPKGTILYEAGDTIRYTYFPHNSVVGLINVLEDGHFVEVASFGREGVCGLISALVSRESVGRYQVQIPGTASRIALSKMQEAIGAQPKLRRLVFAYTEALLAQTLQTVACNAVHPVKARCCSWILSKRDRVDQDTLPLTHADFAEVLGVQRSTVSVVVRTLQAAGLITQQRGGINIVDRAGLEALACECYGKIRQTFARLLPVPSSSA
jgi:CRP-like cAMP-binding protein